MFVIFNKEWRYANNTNSSRDLRFDWMRGYAVMVMIIDHLGTTSYLHIFTGGNRFYISAAEIFVLISGIITGVIYGNLLRRENMKAVIKKAWMRAWTIYKLIMGLTLIIVPFGMYFDSPWTTQLPPKLSWLFVFKIITLQRTFDFVDIPLLYIFLLLVTPAALYLLNSRKTWLLITLSWLLWLVYQFGPVNLFIPPIVKHNGVFQFQTWQLLFFMALTIGYHREAIIQRLATLNRTVLKTYLLILAAIVGTMVFVFLLRFVEPSQTLSASITENRSIIDSVFSKKYLGVGRLLAISLIFQFIFAFLTVYWKPIIRFTSWLLPLGQNSLYAYTLHVLLIMAFHLLILQLPAYTSYEKIFNTTYQFLAVMAVYLMIKFKLFFRFTHH